MWFMIAENISLSNAADYVTNQWWRWTWALTKLPRIKHVWISGTKKLRRCITLYIRIMYYSSISYHSSRAAMWCNSINLHNFTRVHTALVRCPSTPVHASHAVIKYHLEPYFMKSNGIASETQFNKIYRLWNLCKIVLISTEMKDEKSHFTWKLIFLACKLGKTAHWNRRKLLILVNKQSRWHG